MRYNQQEIINYYDTCQSDYERLWNLGGSLAMHAGYWDRTTRSLPEALERENQILAEWAKISSSDHVLDAGCGVGGSSIYLAKNIGCQVTGITLSAHQVEKAEQFALDHSVSANAQFEVMDFCHTTYPDESFDVVWAVESACHAPNIGDFLKESYRLLKPGGRLVIADGFLSDRPLSPSEEQQLNKWLSGWKVGALASVSELLLNFKTEGFSNVSFHDVTKHVMPSSRRLFYLSMPLITLSKLAEVFKLRTKTQTKNLVSAFYQHLTLKRGVWKYGIAYGEKE